MWLEEGKVPRDRLKTGPAGLGAATAHREYDLRTLPLSLRVMLSDLEILSNSRSLQNQFFNQIGLGKVRNCDILNASQKSQGNAKRLKQC